ncbi:hypothetical protein [Simkania sp.]|uniref:hypothetical protein n=1 Tax=Simkania sp. TaxID=34094 RepID=UPI003B51E4BC
MGTVQTNYFVTNEYLLNEKSYFHEAIDLVTLPLRALLNGHVVDLRGEPATMKRNVFDFSKTIANPNLALLASRVLRFAIFTLFAYFYRFSLVSTGLLCIKYLMESSMVESQIRVVEQKSGGTETLKEVRSITLDTTGLEKPANLHPHKSAIYDKMKGEKSWIEDTNIRLTIYPFKRATVKQLPIFSNKCGEIRARDGHFSYPDSKEHQEEWTANFSTPELFSHCLSGDLTQDELQVMEHPGLYHIKRKIDEKPEMGTLKGDEISLITGAKRHGVFLAKYCYGKGFASRPIEDVQGYAFKLDEAESRLFCMSAPPVSLEKVGKPYEKEDLEALFYRSYHAFSKIRVLAKPQKVRIHTGNWGCGVSGHNPRVVALMQVAAAHLAGIDVFEYYPLKAKKDWRVAIYYYESLKPAFSDWTVDNFLTEMANRAESLGFVYRSHRN